MAKKEKENMVKELNEEALVLKEAFGKYVKKAYTLSDKDRKKAPALFFLARFPNEGATVINGAGQEEVLKYLLLKAAGLVSLD